MTDREIQIKDRSRRQVPVRQVSRRVGEEVRQTCSSAGNLQRGVVEQQNEKLWKSTAAAPSTPAGFTLFPFLHYGPI